MPTRYLKPGICDSKHINELSAEAERLYYRLLVNVDDFGRLDARLPIIKSRCFPLKDTLPLVDVEEWLKELVLNSLAYVYKCMDDPYLQINRWDNKPRATESKYPAYSDECIQMYTDVPLTVNRKPKTVNRKLKPKPETKDCQPPKKKAAVGKSITSETWEAYKQAYLARYHVDPIRNAAVNGQLAQIVKRLGADVAPHVAGFYLYSNNSWYIQKGHSVAALLNDCEKLHTEWRTNTHITTTGARQADKKAQNYGVWAKLIEDAERKEARQ